MESDKKMLFGGEVQGAGATPDSGAKGETSNGICESLAWNIEKMMVYGLKNEKLMGYGLK